MCACKTVKMYKSKSKYVWLISLTTYEHKLYFWSLNITENFCCLLNTFDILRWVFNSLCSFSFHVAYHNFMVCLLNEILTIFNEWYNSSNKKPLKFALFLFQASHECFAVFKMSYTHFILFSFFNSLFTFFVNTNS